MAVMAPRMLLRERGSSMRSDAVTGSFVGAAVCGAAMLLADDGAAALCALTGADTDTYMIITAKRNREVTLFIRSPWQCQFQWGIYLRFALFTIWRPAPRRPASRINTIPRRWRWRWSVSLCCCRRSQCP